MDFTYLIVLAAVLIVSPFVLATASSQKGEVKKRLKIVLLIILLAQILLGFLNWENLQNTGRSGFELALTYPISLLGFFFGLSLFQIILLLINNSFKKLVVILNFINSVLIFVVMIRLNNILGVQVVSWSSIGAVFLVLIGNIIWLLHINKDKNLLSKYLHLR